ncbi:hypothetical protein AB1Y20_016444 [Prymnesium parvum]|uniref:FHA domain-containing protein n=1 Tax=Prymnesium parvum TaxID=97485 RepID=A0AB34IG77_PRYPA
MFLDVFKSGELIDTISLSASKRLYLIGRHPASADIVLPHASISRDHASLTVSASGSVVVTDLGSAQGTRLSGVRLPPHAPHALPPGRSLTFGASTRVFKLRAGGAAFAAPPAAAAAPLPAQAQALLAALRRLPPPARLRPDGFVGAAAAAAAAGVGAAQLAGVLAQAKAEAEAVSEGGEMLVRAAAGHAAEMCVDTSLRCRVAKALPPLLVHAIKFKDWNSVRSKGLGGTGCPIRFCVEPPAKGAALPSLGGKAEVLVFVECASIIEAGLEVYELVGEDGQSSGVECLASTGDENGTIGSWHIVKAINAKDGSELLSEEEAKPLREARAKELAARAQRLAAAAAAKEEKKRQKALEEERRLALEAAAQPKSEPRYNPYLAHHEEGVAMVKKANNRTAAGPTVIRKRNRDEEE